jgi:hypothetical protein
MSDHPATEKLQKGEIDGTEPVNVGPEKKGTMKEQAAHCADETREALKDSADRAAKTAADMKQKAGKMAHDAHEEISKKMESLKEGAGTMKDTAGQVAHDTREVVGEKVQGMKEGAAHAAKVVGAAGQRASDAIMNEGDDKDKPLKDQPLKDKGHFEDPLHKDRGFLEPHDKDVVTHDAELREGAFIGAPKKDEFGHSDDAVGPDKKGFTDKLSEKAHNAADIATGAAVTAKEKGQQGLEVAKEKAEETSGKLKESGHDTHEAAAQKAHETKEAAARKVQDTTEAASQKAHETSEWAGDKAHEAKDAAAEHGQHGGDSTKDKAQEAPGLLAGARDTVVQKAHDLQEGVSHVLVAAKDKVVDVGSRVKETIIGPERKGSVKDPNAAHAASESVQQEAHEFREGDDKAHLTKAEHEEPTAGEFHASKIPSAPEHA